MRFPAQTTTCSGSSSVAIACARCDGCHSCRSRTTRLQESLTSPLVQRTVNPRKGVPSRHATPLHRAFSSCPPFPSCLSHHAPSPSCLLCCTLTRSPTHSRALSDVLSCALRRTLALSPTHSRAFSLFCTTMLAFPSRRVALSSCHLLVGSPLRWVALVSDRPCVGSPLCRVALVSGCPCVGSPLCHQVTLASPFRRVALASRCASLVAPPSIALPLPPWPPHTYISFAKAERKRMP